MEKRVAVEQFLNVPLGAERAFSFRSEGRPRGRRRIRRAFAVCCALAFAGLGPLLLRDGIAPLRSGSTEQPASLSVEVSPELSR
ncbi:MAG: hypothetical protein RJA99_4583 [Pseudomonadota bacterium]